MNKIVKLPLILIALLTIGCNHRHIEEEANAQGIKEVSFGIYADYGQYTKERVTLLLGTSIIPFDKNKYNIDTLLVGDYVTISYRGELYIQESYPSRWVMSTLTIEDVKVVHGKVIEYEMVANPGGGQSLMSSPQNEYNFGTNYVINEDGTFIENYMDCPIGTKLYGIHPSYFSSMTIMAFYSYNPLPD